MEFSFYGSKYLLFCRLCNVFWNHFLESIKVTKKTFGVSSNMFVSSFLFLPFPSGHKLTFQLNVSSNVHKAPGKILKNQISSCYGETFKGLWYYRSSHRTCSIEKSALKNVAKFTGKNLCQSLFFETCNFIIKKALVQVFSYKFYEILENTFFIELLRVTASGIGNVHYLERDAILQFYLTWNYIF